jgi:hypothetical protein
VVDAAQRRHTKKKRSGLGGRVANGSWGSGVPQVAQCRRGWRLRTLCYSRHRSRYKCCIRFIRRVPRISARGSRISRVIIFRKTITHHFDSQKILHAFDFRSRRRFEKIEIPISIVAILPTSLRSTGVCGVIPVAPTCWAKLKIPLTSSGLDHLAAISP